MAENREQVDLIKDKVDILDVVQRYVKLKQAGRNFVGLCPFHSEKTPSFSVNPELQIFKCFGCGKGGDVLTFVQEIEKIDFPEALEKLAKEAGIVLQSSESTKKYSHLEEINDFARRYFIYSLKSAQSVKRYIKERGITDESLEKFSIGYAPGDGSFLRYLEKHRSYTKKQLIEAGLFVEKDGKLREKFRKRVMFPILSPRGKTIGFSGRLLPTEKFGPKYLNSPETPIFSKRLGVYGIYEARQAMRKEDLCIICEGQTDVISAHQIGIENIVAPLGTGLTPEQLQSLSRHTSNILFLFDNDEAGQRALERGFALSSQLGLNAFASSPEPYGDFDEMIQKEPKLAKDRVKAKSDAFSYLLSSTIKGKNLTDYSTYTKVVAYLSHILEPVKDRTMLDFYIKKAKTIADIDLNEKVKVPTRNTRSEEAQDLKQQKLSTEQYYLKALLSQNSISIPKDHDIEYFREDAVKTILKKIAAGKSNDIKSIRKDLEPALAEGLEAVIMHPSKIDPDDLDDLHVRVAKKAIQEEIKGLRIQLATAEEKRDRKETNRLFAMIQKSADKLKSISE